MATITGLTAQRMIAMENATVVDGDIVGNDLILVTKGGTQINAGNVRGPQGPGGSGFVICTSTTRPSLLVGDEGKAIYETDTDLTRMWSGTRWVLQPRIVCTSSTRPAGLVAADEGVVIYETDTNLEFVWTGTSWQGGGPIPLGGCIDYFGATEPAGWKFPNGQTLSRTTYAALFGLIGTTYGPGDGTTFALPDKRKRVGVMAGTGLTLGSVGGAETHVLTLAEIASHGHGVNIGSGTENANHSHGFAAYTNDGGYHGHAVGGQGGPVVAVSLGSGINQWMAAGYGNGWLAEFTTVDPDGNHNHYVGGTTGGISTNHAHNVTGNTNLSGGAGAHNNMQPYIVCNSLMRVV